MPHTPSPLSNISSPESTVRIRPAALQPPMGACAYQVRGAATLREVRLQDGDLLCVTGDPEPEGLALLLPTTYGHPMVGRRERNGLRAEPSGVPCGLQRWRVAGAVAAIWRRGLSRTTLPWSSPVVPQASPTGHSFCIRIPEAAIALARLKDGLLTGRPLAVVTGAQRIVQVSAEARLLGLQPGMSVGDATPDMARLVLLPDDPTGPSRLARKLARALGPNVDVERADSQEIRLVGDILVVPEGLGAWIRSLAGVTRVPLAIGIARQRDTAREAARAIGPDELLVVLPGATRATPLQRAATGLPANTQPAQQPSQRQANQPLAQLPHGAPSAAPHEPCQLRLFEATQAA